MIETARQFQARWPLLFTLAAAALLGGCGGKSSDSSANVDPSPRPLRAMNSAVRRGQWAEAWKHADAVLAAHSDDAEAVAAVAHVAHENKKPEVAAKLLVDACRLESFANAKRVQQAMIAMIGVGRLHEGMAMLEEAVQKQPLQHETRRWLYDFYMGTENRAAGVPHGRYLIRARKFDLELLMTLSNTERRTQDSKPLEEMTSRNPDDKRPQLGVAKSEFDKGDYQQSIATLRSIIEAHEDYLPAQSLLGRALAASGQYEELEKWSQSQTPAIEAYSGYWIALGDWARAKQQPAAAARAYWEATRRDPDVLESWSKLSTTLQQMQSAGTKFPSKILADVETRVTLLSSFNQLKNRFERTGSISRATAVEIAQTLRQLGRLWEAEAWASITLGLPEDDAVAAQQVRDSIVALLRSDTPWQMSEQIPELQNELSNFDLPAIGALVHSSEANSLPPEMRTADGNQAVDAGNLSLLNEAQERGLTFFGRTDDHLDVPGIMLFRTLGCGGGTIDFDLDGWSDLYLVAAGGTPPKRDSDTNTLQRNTGGTFLDITVPSGSGDTGFGQGVSVGDVNEDGFPDLLVLNYGANTLLINNGDGTFADASARLGPVRDDWSTSAAIADLDGDGLCDIVIVNYCSGFEPVTRPCPMSGTDISRSCTPVMFAAAADVFLQGGPTGTWTDRTTAWDAKPSVLGRGLGIVVGSFGKTNSIDVLIANDMTNNHYWRRASSDEEPFRLMDSAIVSGLGGDERSLAQGSMGIASGDFDRDGDIDFYVTNFENEYNTYHEQRFPGIWQDRTSQVQLIAPTMPLVGFGTEAVDLDHDGSLELVVSNGHVEMFTRGDEQSVYAQPMQVFRRNQANTFDSVGGSLAGEYASTPHVGRALWTIDANGDSLTDFVVTHQTEPVALLINHSENVGNSLAIKLVGRTCSRDAIGARVELTAGDQRWSAVQTSGDGYLSSNERLLRFGLGDTEGDCDVKVTWPDGATQDYRGLRSNAVWTLVQGDEQAFEED